jgi:hypothetical protein
VEILKRRLGDFLKDLRFKSLIDYKEKSKLYGALSVFSKYSQIRKKLLFHKFLQNCQLSYTSHYVKEIINQSQQNEVKLKEGLFLFMF